MSVDFYNCDCCNESVYEEDVHTCANCQQNVCITCAIEQDDGDYFTTLCQFDRDENPDDYKKNLKEIKKYGLDEEYMDEDMFNPKFCPFCNKKEVGDQQIINYLLKKTNMTLEEVKKEILK
jgi:hypothetical protein